MTKTTTSTTRNNAVLDLTYHLVLVTKYRRKALSVKMLIRFCEIAAETLAAWRCTLLEYGRESDHVHPLLRAHPALDLSRLVNNLKTVTSRLLRKEFPTELARFYWVPVLWHGAYYVGSVGNASLATVKGYVEHKAKTAGWTSRRASQNKRKARGAA
jgi:putative transposase